MYFLPPQIEGKSVEDFLRTHGVHVSRSDLYSWNAFDAGIFLPVSYYNDEFTMFALVIDTKASLDQLNYYLSGNPPDLSCRRFFLVRKDILMKVIPSENITASTPCDVN